MYILDNPIPLETSSDEASERPIRNRSLTSRSSSSVSSDDVDLNTTQPSGARNPSSGSSRKAFPPPTRGNVSSNKHNRPPSPRRLGSKENLIDVEKVGSLFEPIVIREYVWENTPQFAYADNIL